MGRIEAKRLQIYCGKYPEYLELVMIKLEGEKTMQYIQHFCSWINNEVSEASKSHIKGVRTRRGMPTKLPIPCPDGCAEFTGKGTNYKRLMNTCVVCGHGTQDDRVETSVYSPETCPHDVIDRRGSPKDAIMLYCKQCCTHIDCRPRA